jgi:hypothetical protein
MTTDKPARKKVFLAYAGEAELKGGSVGHQFFEVPNYSSFNKEVDLEKMRCFAKGKGSIKHVFIGGIFSFDETEDGGVYTATRKWVADVRE